MRTDDPLLQVGDDSLPPVRDVLAAIATGLWRWDNASGTVTLDAEAARLLGLPARAQTLSEAGVRSRFHPVDWNEIYGTVQLAVAEGTLAEARLRIMDETGRRVLRTVRSRSKPVMHGATEAYELVGTLQEVTEPAPGTAARTPVTGDWRRSREAFLLDAGRALAEARSTEEVLRVAGGLSMPGFSPDGLAVFGVEGERLTIIGHHGHEPGDDGPFSAMPLDTDYPAAEVVRTGRAVYLSTPEDYRRRYPAAWPLASRFERQSWAFLPLTVAGRTMGAWMAAFTYPVSFTPDERSVLTTVARMLAQALSRAGVAESERELTEGLQRSMLPMLGPQIPGMSVAARYVPTGGGLQVGGDWYDMIPLPSGRIAFVIGDVQGHDVRAAGLMGQLRIALRAYASEGHRPDAVLSRATRFLSGITESITYGSSGTGADEANEYDPRFATCLYVEADPATGVLEMARAGHPEPAIRMSDGTVLLRPAAGGLPLGIDPDADYPTTRLVLEPGETMLICTDGLIETGGHDLDTGWSRIRATLEEYAGEGEPDALEQLADALVQAVHGPSSHHTTGPFADRREDDIAVLLLSRTGHPERRTDARRTVLTVAQAEPERIAGARSHLRDLLHDWADDDQVDSAVLMVSEMLTNVLVHTDGDALMVAEVTGEPGARRLRAEVADGSDDLPHKRHPGELASSGRGLVLMELLAGAWGVDPRGDGKSIWFELYEDAGASGGFVDVDDLAMDADADVPE
ncbi:MULTISPECIES: SpoIIE family protein phosphatase [Streptomyces]|uniref:protein-serine/threonine phosphatase n=1 Tax=Streptomyces venezuelae TaxID=54571 RepID=A0A5P2BF18_STRVZ|nr:MULTISPECIES: SpoIIE family protein phosphatase [Streptomyces]NEA02896.1 SpoIIE family protein phosphatase [Streptomyces sp. SID10116]MYY84188.1 SpoIIE family protein phosphatase [Streptomyces sp. SID335]MYZ14173.1 SpoIIE family protein phosphatase [Streptomyces sp. SID337]NDZ90327.1 SpoIIE family protein phosphatase [Streptomyces sp. SID10115]NEB45697.1 SpoIIE family protein phosphatase [Streptomyces sp. SID339]